PLPLPDAAPAAGRVDRSSLQHCLPRPRAGGSPLPLVGKAGRLPPPCGEGRGGGIERTTPFLRSTHVRQAGSWRPDGAQLGWIIENRIDEAYVLSWPGQLETYVPLHDTGGYDRARAPLGSYDFRLDQIKGTASTHQANVVELGFNTPALHPRRHLDFTVARFDLKIRDLVDPAWLFSSTRL